MLGSWQLGIAIALFSFNSVGQQLNGPANEPGSNAPGRLANEIDPAVLLPPPAGATVPARGLRSRPVRINRALFHAPPARLFFPLFEGQAVWAELHEIKTVLGNVTVLKGKLEHPWNGDFTLVADGYVVSGVVSLGRKSYSIQHVTDSLHMVVEADPAEGFTCGVDGNELGAEEAISSFAASWDSVGTPQTGGLSGSFSATSSSTATLDLLVVYSQAAGFSGIRSDIVVSVEQLNTVFQNSQVDVVANLLHVQEVQYTETGSSSNDLSRLRSPNDGFLDDVQRLKNGIGADLVCLVVSAYPTNDFTGRANVLRTWDEHKKDHSAVVERSGVGSGKPLLFAHEIGHNLGGQHDRETAAAQLGFGYYTNSYGYRSTAGQFYTAMAYRTGTLAEIKYFSNPNVLYQGHPTGIASGTNTADNAATFNYTAPRIAAWRSVTRLSSPRFSTGGLFQFDITGPVASGNVEYSADLDNWYLLGSASSGATYTDGSSGSAGIRFYRTTRTTTNFTSANIVGFVRCSLSAGYNYLSNPLSHGNNTVRSIFPSVQDGTIVSKWDDTTQSYINNSYDIIDGWLNPNMVITPGEGMVVYAPNAVTYNFRGEVLEGELSNVMPAGAQYSLRGSMVPQSGLLQTKLSYGPKDLDLVQIYNTATQTFDSYTFDMLDGAVWLPAEPFLPVAKSAWFQRAQTTREHEWMQRFWVPRAP